MHPVLLTVKPASTGFRAVAQGLYDEAHWCRVLCESSPRAGGKAEAAMLHRLDHSASLEIGFALPLPVRTCPHKV